MTLPPSLNSLPGLADSCFSWLRTGVGPGVGGLGRGVPINAGDGSPGNDPADGLMLNGPDRLDWQIKGRLDDQTTATARAAPQPYGRVEGLKSILDVSRRRISENESALEGFSTPPWNRPPRGVRGESKKRRRD